MKYSCDAEHSFSVAARHLAMNSDGVNALCPVCVHSY